jgi:hypothetical protein
MLRHEAEVRNCLVDQDVVTLDVVFIKVEASGGAKEMLDLVRAFNPLVWLQVANRLVGSCSLIRHFLPSS